MAKHMVVCLYCGKSFDCNEEPFVKPRSNRYAHKNCAENAKQKKSQEEIDKEILETYILQLFEISCISPKIKRQLKEYKEKYNYSDAGIYKSLVYFFDIRKNSIDKANGGIGIVPYIFKQAQDYFKAIEVAQQNNHKIVAEVSLPQSAREIRIPSPKSEPLNIFQRLFSFLDKGDEKE